MRIAIAADEEAYTIKDRLSAALIEQGHDVIDVTRRTLMRTFLEYVEEVGFAVLKDDAVRGIVITSRSVAASLAAARVPGIRAAICGDVRSAEVGAAEEGMNVLVLSCRQNALEKIVEGYLRASLVPDGGSQGLPPHRLKLVFSHIEGNIAEPLKVAELAHVIGMSEYYFSKLFKVSTGLTPHRYIMRERIEQARAYLRETELELKEIALRTGFETQSHFSSVFHRLTGITPKRYREMNSSMAAAEAEKVAGRAGAA